MSTRSTALAAITAWVAVVLLGSTLVWTVISRAGEDVTTATGPAIRARSAGTAPAGSPRGTPTRRPSGATSAAAPSAGTTSVPTSPAPPASQPASPTPAAPPASPPTAPAVSVERRTWQGPGGVVVAECRGAVISLAAAQADSGFRVEVESRGPQEVNVQFRGQGEEGRETEVQAECHGGAPAFQAQTDS